MNAPHAAPLVTLVRGSRDALRRHLGTRGGRSPDAVAFADDRRLAVPLGGARQLLGALQLRLDDGVVDAALAPHRALLSLSLRGLVGSLDASERQTREHESALFLATLPGTGLSARPVLEAWADALAPLLARAPLALVIPDAARVDPGSLALLRPLLSRIDPAARRAVLVGLPTDAEPPEDPIDRRVAEINSDEVGRLRALPGVTIEDLAEGPADADASTGSPVTWHPLDDGIELRAAECLGAPVDRELLLAALRASFAGFGFATALRLANMSPTAVPAQRSAMIIAQYNTTDSGAKALRTRINPASPRHSAPEAR